MTDKRRHSLSHARLSLLIWIMITAHSLCRVDFTPSIVDPLTEPWRITRYEELGQKAVTCIAQADDGIMWFGLRTGLVQYDGVHWQYHLFPDSLSGERVHDIAFDNRGQLIVKTFTLHLYRFDGEHFHNIPLDFEVYEQANLFFRDADGALWFGSQKGVLKWADNTLTCFHPSGTRRVYPHESPTDKPDFRISNVFQESDTSFLVKERNGGMFRAPYQNGALSPVASWVPHPVITEFNRYIELHCCRVDGHHIWISTVGGNQPALSYNLRTQEKHTLDPARHGGNNTHLNIIQLKNGSVFIAGHSALFRFEENQWTALKYGDLDLPQSALRLYEDFNGNLWIAGKSAGGVLKIDYRYDQWLSYHNLHYHCTQANGTDWFITSTGQIVRRRADREHWESFDTNDGLIDLPLALLRTHDDEIWAAGAHQGLSAVAKFEGERWMKRVFPTFSTHIDYRSFCEAPDGSLWLGAGGNADWKPGLTNGLLRSDISRTRWNQIEMPFAASRQAGLSFAPDGRLWFGGMRLASFYHDELETLYDFPPSLSGWWDDVITTDSGDIWGAKGGDGVYRRSNGEWQPFNEAHDLASTMVSALLEMHDGSILAGTDRGISRHKEGWATYALPPSIAIPRESGTLRQSPDGALWINRASRDWYFRVQTPEPDQKNQTQFFHTTRYIADRQAPETMIITNQHKVANDGRILIQWQGKDPWENTRAEELQYSHRLDDSAWSPYTSGTQIELRALRSGSHLFEVRSRDRDLNVDSSPAQIRFTVEPPLWKTPWFLSVLGLFVCIIFMLTLLVIRRNHRLETSNRELVIAAKRLKEQTILLETANKELESFSYSVSHDLRAPLRAINGFSTILINDYKEALDDQGRRFLEHIRRNTQSMGKLIDDLLLFSRSTRQKMHLHHVDMEHLINEVMDELREITEKKSIELNMTNLPEAWCDRPLIKQVMTNLLSNAIKFSNHKETIRIEINGRQTRDHAIYSVRDHGIGFDMTYAHKLFTVFQRLHGDSESEGTGIGLALAERIIRRHGGTIIGESVLNEGATFTFSLPNPVEAS